MKGFLNKRDVVVPLQRAKQDMLQDLPPLAMQVAHMEMQFDKLLYRLQNLERREKSQRNLIARLRRKVSDLEKGSTAEANKEADVVSQHRPSSGGQLRQTPSLSTTQIEPLSTLDFEAAAEDLTQGRH